METNTSSPGPATASKSLVGQAQQWLRQSNLTEVIGKVPTSLKSVGSSIGKLSTTQKVVGGAALALGVGLLARKSSGKRSAQATTLQELLLFVNDRIAGYERAVAESSDTDLRMYYQQLVRQSQQFADNLNAQLEHQGGASETGTTLKGKLYLDGHQGHRHGWRRGSHSAFKHLRRRMGLESLPGRPAQPHPVEQHSPGRAAPVRRFEAHL
jgi:hypothetical protein